MPRVTATCLVTLRETFMFGLFVGKVRVTYLHWKWSSRRLESWEGLSVVSDWRFENLTKHLQSHLTLKMASAQVVKTSIANNSPFQDSYHPDDHFQFKVCSSWVQTILLLGLLFMYIKGLELGGQFLTFIVGISRQKWWWSLREGRGDTLWRLLKVVCI